MKIERNQQNMEAVAKALRHLGTAGRLCVDGFLQPEIMRMRADLLQGNADPIAIEELKDIAEALRHSDPEIRAELIRGLTSVAFALLPSSHSAKRQ
jgi:hypothetical protein